MSEFKPVDEHFERRVRDSFDSQEFMKTLGARLTRVEPGLAELELDFSPKLTQQHGYAHAGAITTIADNACGYAAYSLMSAKSEVLSVEFKVNFLAPAKGWRFVATGRVIKPGKTLTVCSAEVHAQDDSETRLIFIMQATMICIPK